MKLINPKILGIVILMEGLIIKTIKIYIMNFIQIWTKVYKCNKIILTMHPHRN